MSNSYPRRVRTLLLVAQFYGLIVLFLAIPVVAVLFSMFQFPRPAWILLLAVLIPYGVIGLFIVRAMLPRNLTVRPNGIPLHESEAPRLFEMCREAAKIADFEKPFSVYVDLSPGPSS